AVDVAAQRTATADLKLHKVDDLAPQLTNAEWLISVPGTEQQKSTLLNCMGCHTVQRIAQSQHDANDFRAVLKRMAGYANQSTPLHPQKRRAERLLEQRGEERELIQQKQAEWLSTINLGRAAEWDYALKTLPRPTGRGTQIVYTEYDLPRPTIEPHGVNPDADGPPW